MMYVKVDRINQALHKIETPFGGEGTVFIYLLKGDSVALVDTGAQESPREVLEPALAQIGMALSDVDLILNTHSHLDHAGGNLAVKAASGARIHVHANDLFMARSTDAQAEFMTAAWKELEFPAAMVQGRADYVYRMAGEAAGADVVLSDGDTVELGGGIKLRVVHNPGHTPGSVSYLWESEGILISGDGAQGQGSRMGGYPLYFDAPSYRRSLARLAGMDFRMLCLGHAYLGGALINEPIREGAAGAAFIKESIRVADAIQKAAAEAVRKMPGASKRELALAAVSELIFEIPQLLVRATRMPGAAAPALVSHIDAAINGTYPA